MDFKILKSNAVKLWEINWTDQYFILNLMQLGAATPTLDSKQELGNPWSGHATQPTVRRGHKAYVNPLEPSGILSCHIKQCYSYESTIIKPALKS